MKNQKFLYLTQQKITLVNNLNSFEYANLIFFFLLGNKNDIIMNVNLNEYKFLQKKQILNFDHLFMKHIEKF